MVKLVDICILNLFIKDGISHTRCLMRSMQTFIFLIGISYQQVYAETCRPTLWPTHSFTADAQKAAIYDLQNAAKKALNQLPKPITTLSSAGKTNKNDPILLASRRAFQDADYAAVLALMFQLTQKPIYFNKAKDILLSWSAINSPTGNPIDETRLAGLIWAYDLIACHLSHTDKAIIVSWLEQLRSKKIEWKFGSLTSVNNHRTHQLKILLMLDKVLHHQTDWQQDLATTIKHSTININVTTGESIDYQTRTALHYHNYDLQPWLEINLISHCCQASTTKAFTFLINRVRSHKINGEFLHSTAKIDALRAKSGFTYAKTGGMFDVTEASPTILTFYTIHREQPAADLQTIIQRTKASPWLSFVKARYDLMKN